MNCNKWSKNSDERWHNGLVTTRGGEWMHPYLDPDLIHVSLCQMSQSPKRHLDRFCRFFGSQCISMGQTTPPNCLFPYSSNTSIPGPIRVSIPDGISISSPVYAQLTTVSLYFTMGRHFSSKAAPSPWGLRPP